MDKLGEPPVGGVAAPTPSTPTVQDAGTSGSAQHAGPSAPPTMESKRVTSKRKRVITRKPSANKIAGIPTRKRSKAWDQFKRVPDEEVSEPTAECIYCGIRFLCDRKEHGTSNMLAHIPKCPKSTYVLQNDPKQQVLNFDKISNKKVLVGSTPHVYSLEDCRKAISLFVICDEQPFRVVEGFSFKNMCKKLNPQLHAPSRHTVRRDCMKIYEEEKTRLRGLLKSDCVRACITTDCWTSVQNLNYMALTIHFIDNEWKLQKRITNFCLIPNHKGETIGKHIEQCLNEWGVRKLFTITMDNASANDGAIAYLKKKLRNWKGLVVDGEMIHMRCCAHILNLIVNEGLKDLHSSIAAIRNAVRYVRSSPSRLGRFKQAIEEEHITHKSLVCLDVPTRWNSTYNMLEEAEKYQKAFGRLENEDNDYSIYFIEDAKRVGPPTSNDWNNARAFINFLKIFYDVTLSFSSSLHVTSNSAFTNLALIQSEIKKWSQIEKSDSVLHVMAHDMTTKFEKYWGMIENMNPIIFIANVLDPRYKLAYITWSFEEIYGEVMAEAMAKKVKANLIRLYEWYSKEYEQPSAATSNQEARESQNPSFLVESHAQKVRSAAFRSHLRNKDTLEAKNEVEKYLHEACEDEDEKFDILDWWKTNASRFNILSKIARDVLAVPVSTVASESAFSTGGRVLDAFRSSLTPKMTEALICTQNWVRPSPIDINDIEDYKELNKCEEVEKEFLGGGTLQSTLATSIGETSASTSTSSGVGKVQTQQHMAAD